MKCTWGGSWGNSGLAARGLWCKDAWGSRYEKGQCNSSPGGGRITVWWPSLLAACSSSSGILRLSWVGAKLWVYATLHFLLQCESVRSYEMPSSPDWTATVFLILLLSKNVLFKQIPKAFYFCSQLSAVNVLGLCIEPPFLKKKPLKQTKKGQEWKSYIIHKQTICFNNW